MPIKLDLMRFALIALCCFFYFTIRAQDKKSVQSIGWRAGSVELHTISNKQQACSFVVGKDSVKAFLIDKTAGAIELFTVKKRMEELFLGAFIKNGNVYLFMNNGKQPGLHSWRFTLNDKNLTEHVIPFAIKNEKIINRLSGDNHFFYFTVNKKTSEFIIYKFIDEINFERHNYPVETNIWDAIADRAGLLNAGDINIEKTDMEGECDIDIAECARKLYVRNDTLLLVLNNQKGTTTVYTFDIVSNNMNKRVIENKADQDNKLYMVYNSFLLGNKLYYASATEDALVLQVIDFYSGKVLKEFTSKSDEEIDFKNTPIIQEGNSFVAGVTRELGKTKQLLRKMTNSRLVITALHDDSSHSVILLLGSYKKVKYYNGGGMWVGSAGAAPIFLPTGGFSRSSWSKSARFKMLINDFSSEHINGDIPPSINDKIEVFTAGLKVPSDCENLFLLNEKYFYAFYDKEERSLSVVQF